MLFKYFFEVKSSSEHLLQSRFSLNLFCSVLCRKKDITPIRVSVEAQVFCGDF